MSTRRFIANAIDIAVKYGGIDGAHHKTWVIDQMLRALTGCPLVERTTVDCNGKKYSYYRYGESDEYKRIVAMVKNGEDGPNTYDWDEGTPP